MAAFGGRQARSLVVALNYSGHEQHDATGLTRVMRGEAIVPPRLVEAVRRRLLEEGAAGRAVIPVHPGVEADRAYYLVATSDIAEAAVPSLLPPKHKRAPSAPPDPRFEIERDAGKKDAAKKEDGDA